MLQQLAQVSAFSSPLIFKGKACKERCKCKVTFVSSHLTLEPFVHRYHLAFFNSCKNYNAVLAGTGITTKMHAKGCLKALGLLLLPPLKHHKPETADVASDAVP